MASLKNIEWPDVLGALSIGVVIGFVAISFIAITANHQPKFYYIEKYEAGVPCVQAWQEWFCNAKVYCSDDPTKLLTIMDRMNQSIAAGKK